MKFKGRLSKRQEAVIAKAIFDKVNIFSGFEPYTFS